MTALLDPAFDALDPRHAVAEIGLDALPLRDSVLDDSLPRWGDQATLFPWEPAVASDLDLH